jgi:HEAT repeat protein
VTLETLGTQGLSVVPALRAALRQAAWRDADEDVRQAAVQAVVQLGPQPRSALAALSDSLEDELAEVRFQAAISLGEMGKEARPATGALIRTHLYDPDPAVRAEAAVALWKIDRQAEAVVPALIRALGEANEFVCWIAADCLGDIGPAARDAVPALRAALSSWRCSASGHRRRPRHDPASVLDRGLTVGLKRPGESPKIPLLRFRTC